MLIIAQPQFKLMVVLSTNVKKQPDYIIISYVFKVMNKISDGKSLLLNVIRVDIY